MEILVTFILIFTILPPFTSGLELVDVNKFSKVSQECSELIKVDDQIMVRALRGEMVHDRGFDCFIACLLEKTGMVKSDGFLNADLAVSKVPPKADFHDALVDAIYSCSREKGRDNCSTAHMLLSCMHMKKIPALFFGH